MTALSEEDYNVDMGVLMTCMGIEPGTVAADSAKVQFLDGKVVLTYTAIRAIPTRVMGMALLRSATEPELAEQPTEESVAEPTPIRKTAKKTAAKKTTTKR